MRWVAPTEKDTANETLEKRLWDAAMPRGLTPVYSITE
jgi:hypothetical protein